MSRFRPCCFVLLMVLAPALGAQVTGGSLDLTHWNTRDNVSLSGSWNFWYQSVPTSRAPLPVPVPGSWTAAVGQSTGWGTYQLRIEFPAAVPGRLALYVPMLGSAGEVFWNGESVWKLGEWEKERYRPLKKTGVAEVLVRPGENLLEVRVANYGDINPGLIEPLVLGTPQAMTDFRYSDIITASALFFGLVLMGLYHLGLFAFRSRDQGPLWFGLLAMMFSLRGVLYGSAVVGDILPGLDWEIAQKFWYWTFSASALFFVLFIIDVFPSVAPRWLRPLSVLVAGGYSVWILVTPASWYVVLLLPFSIFVVLVAVVVVGMLVTAAVKKLPSSYLFLTGFLVLFTTVVHDILKSNLLLPTPFLGQAGLVIFLVFQSLVLAHRFTRAYADAEHYSNTLEVTNGSLQRFIPQEILSFLDKKSIVDVELGDFSERPMVVMFTDIRDFTSLSETLTPRENFQFINSYLSRMGPVIRKHHGFVDKYIGDGIMALFPGRAEDAVHAALEMRTVLVEYNRQRALAGYKPLRIGMGLHWGHLMMGTIGENQRMDSTVISDTVNTASRLEGLTKTLGTDILVSGETLAVMEETTRQSFGFQFLSREAIRGRQGTVEVFGVPGAALPMGASASPDP